MSATTEYIPEIIDEAHEADGYRQLADTLALLEAGANSTEGSDERQIREGLANSSAFLQKLLETDYDDTPVARGTTLNHAWDLSARYIGHLEAYEGAHRHSGTRQHIEATLDALEPTIRATKITGRNADSFLKVVDRVSHLRIIPYGTIKSTVTDAMADAHEQIKHGSHQSVTDKYGELLKDQYVLSMLGDFTTQEEGGRRFSYRDYEKRHKMLADILRGFGITNAWECQKTWSHTTSEGRHVPDVRSNLIRIASLEEAAPGGPQLLHDFYGIRGFARYPEYVLRRQIEIHGKADRPYGITVSALDDHNGSIKRPSNLYHDEQLNEHYDVRVIEAGSSIELARRMLALDKLYGGDQKISFAVVHAHGSADSFSLGSSFLLAEMAAISVKNRFEKSRRFFVKHPVILMQSCSTGKEQGIAQKLSRDLDATVIGPEEDSGMDHVVVSISDGQLKLEPKYVTDVNAAGEEEWLSRYPVAANLYVNGERIIAEKYNEYFAELTKEKVTHTPGDPLQVPTTLG